MTSAGKRLKSGPAFTRAEVQQRALHHSFISSKRLLQHLPSPLWPPSRLTAPEGQYRLPTSSQSATPSTASRPRFLMKFWFFHVGCKNESELMLVPGVCLH